jgi:hypothetical protein
MAFGVARASGAVRAMTLWLLFDAITCQCIGYFDQFPLLPLLGRALKTDLITLPRLHRILSML